ncbi:3-dehydroquinate synthase [Bacillus sp. FJAT-27225]|uniref:3-dehydroquinate synthase n=1 Tax=Bacillus sp. FJAT-27225 TaxID=1743144 RepID=UPI00080C2201|nr:3-dehydroquinate synthase [Bacillus sp. FJAT-27225]OCA90929.1 3-dehydroquinate synthase [Bacillus sp. FJAT-27225]
MATIQIKTGSKDYPVVIGQNAIHEIDPFLRSEFPDLTKLMVITDANVAPLYLEKLQASLHGFQVAVFTAPGGEEAKSIDTYYRGMTAAFEAGLDRKSLVLALGGGAVGDLAGFMAATFMRGISFIQVPTTILAHDSSVGGKTGINHHLGKNLIGSFHQPEAVFYDISFLGSLPVHEIRSGFAELIKHALIGDPELYKWMKTNIKDLAQIPAVQYETILARGIKVKAAVVSEDEREQGVRAHLNFGHTLGHAIEAESGYGTITHGEAVMHGMLFALQVSKEEAGLEFNLDEFISWIKSIGYETRLPEGFAVDGLLSRMKKDKKAVGGKLRFIVLEEIGKPIVKVLDSEMLMRKLASFI